jgi:LacI family transcriptional regulator
LVNSDSKPAVETAGPAREQHRGRDGRAAAERAKGLRHVALLIETSGSYGRGLLRGVARYNRENGNWSTYFQPHGLGAPAPEWLKGWEGDGILARIEDKNLAKVLAESGLPVVNLRGTLSNLPFAYVGLDHGIVGTMAAQHLLERGIKHFGFCGKPRGVHPGLDQRGDEFRRAVEAAGYSCDVYAGGPVGSVGERRSRARDSWEQEQEKLVAWICSLPRPVGVLAANDERGLNVLDACRRCGAQVPEEVAVIGVDNDEHLCELSIPPMTSIDVNAEQIGYVAAQLLDKLMSGGKAPKTPTLVRPRGVVTRRSTDVLASEDPIVNRAVAFIREQGGRGIQVPDVVAHVKTSRASLEPRFKKILGRTIHQEIQRVQLDRVKELLIGTTAPIKQVAREGGFSCVQYLTRVFRAATGETPAKYRAYRQR